MFRQPHDLFIQAGQLCPQLPPSPQKRQRRRGQDVIVGNQLPHPGLVSYPGDMPKLQAEVPEHSPHREFDVDDRLLNRLARR